MWFLVAVKDIPLVRSEVVVDLLCWLDHPCYLRYPQLLYYTELLYQQAVS